MQKNIFAHKSSPDNERQIASSDALPSISSGEPREIILTEEERAEVTANIKAAKRIRTMYDMMETMSFLFLIIVSASMTFIMVVCCASVETTSLHIRLDTAERATIIYWTSTTLMTTIGVFWVAYWLEGWVFNYTKPRTARLGKSKAWFDAMNDALQDEEEGVAEGLTLALNLSWRSKIKSAHVQVWSILLSIFAFVLGILFIINLRWDSAFSESCEDLMEYMLTTSRNRIIMGLGGEVPDRVQLQPLTATLLFIFPTLISAIFGLWLWRRAAKLKWTLLSVPDFIRKHIYFWLFRRQGTTSGVTHGQLQRASYRFMLLNALSAAPEDFVSLDDHVFSSDEPIKKQVCNILGLPLH